MLEGEERWEAPDYLQCVLTQNWEGKEPHRTVAFWLLKANANDRRKYLTLCRDELHRPQSDTMKQEAFEKTRTYKTTGVLLEMDLIILNNDEVTRTAPELKKP
ncbi:hypothetical protein TNCV_287311 [Trichonephila clavipes]|nr:hypothetical protein TNCV_287311 [Trichonephila clavipes]